MDGLSDTSIYLEKQSLQVKIYLNLDTSNMLAITRKVVGYQHFCFFQLSKMICLMIISFKCYAFCEDARF